MSADIGTANDPAAPIPVARTNPSPDEQAGLAGLLEVFTRWHAPEGAAEARPGWQMAMTMLRQGWADALDRRVTEAALAALAIPALPPASVLSR